ncbi:MAG: hypothetical protein V3T53_06860 [Phycisphaerales bacterium]
MLNRYLFKNRVRCASAAMIAMFVISVAAHGGGVLYVDDDAPPGGDGTSWNAAYRFLQDGLTDACAGGIAEIRVGQGTYTPDRDEANPDGTGDREATFQLCNGVALMGGYAGIGAKDPDDRDIELYETILTGDLLGNDGPDFQNNDENSYHVMSGHHTGTASIDGLIITAGNADGVFVGSCLTGEAHGGGLVVCSGDLVATRCTFLGNRAKSGGGVSVFGQLSDNTLFVDCIFVDNDAFQGGGGGLSRIGGHPRLVNCLIANNIALDGGAIFTNFNTGTILDLINCTVVENEAHGGQTGGINISGGADITNCVLWANENDQLHVTTGPGAAVSYSCVQGGWPGEGNIDADPLFVDPDNGDFRLSSGSPSIDAGNNWGVPIDANDYDEDGILCELFPVDLDDNPRFNADEADFDPGCGVPVVVDIGAYEYQFDPADQVTFADLNGDDSVGAADLLGLLASWGPCGKGCCLADLDIDGTVGASDLLALLANWGPCP